MTLLAAALGGMLVSLALERPVRSVHGVALHCALWGLGYLAAAAAFQRPLLAAALALCAQALLGAVNRAKLRALREPFVYADFGLFGQAIAHPRLYLPYLPLRTVVPAAAAAGALLGAIALFEERSFDPYAWSALAAAAGATLAALRPPVAFEPARDVARLGLLATAWLYWRAERAPIAEPASPFAAPPRRAPPRPPHIVVVQSESFFDPRRIGVALAPGALAHFDALRREGHSGRLAVPAWGAYTMRGEFAFLSGIAPEALGVHRFNPYRRYARRRVPTLAWALRAHGYRTVCVHPYPASFFARHRVFEHLGFERFLDVRSFAGAARAGPWVADAEVARKVLEVLAAATAPAFVFAITMENHGPLHLEAGPGEDELAVYLRHLANADAMFGTLAAALAPGSVLCAYGDHVPSMPAVYAARRFDDPRTDYVVWRKGASEAREADLPAERLGALVLRVAGFG